VNALESALYSRLTASAGVMAVAAAVVNSVAPRGQALPVCLFSTQAGLEESVSPRRSLEMIVFVKGIARSKATASQIAEAAAAALHNQPLAVTGWQCNYWLARSSYVSYVEADPAQPSENIFHVGWEYVIRLAADS
jgi:hypothetical protein